MKKILAIGEALIDFIPNKKGCKLQDVSEFKRVVGGAPANVCSAISKLGGKSSMITQLGNDAFGDLIIDTLKDVGVSTEYIVRTSKANTALAFVSLQEDGNRDFSFYRNPSADMLLEEKNIRKDWFKDAYALHFCSVDLIESPMKYAHKKSIEYALDNNCIISFDPNVRLPLWNNEEDCRKTILEFMPFSHILKISDEEIEFITGKSNIEDAKEVLFKGNTSLVLFTKGAKGVEIVTKKNSVSIPSIKVNAVDTTGAGDACIGAFLYKLLKDNVSIEEIESLSVEKLNEYASFANTYSAYTTLSKGAIESYPNKLDIDRYIEMNKLKEEKIFSE